jgi:DNA helicase HerA-like ATPase
LKIKGVKPVIFLDISGSGTSLSDDDEIKALLLKEIVSSLTWQGEEAFKKDEKLNCLVAIDEAHRFVSKVSHYDDESDRASLAKYLVKGVRETRKYGLGYLFITQTIASLDSDVIGQLRIKFFGHGLNMGQELAKLKEEIGGDSKALSLYTSFIDPAK